MDGKIINVIAKDYFEIFLEEKVTPGQLAFALKKVKATCRFFPKIVDFMDQVQVYRANPPRTQKASNALRIVDNSNRQMTQEEADDGIRKVRAIVAVATGKMDMDKAIEIAEAPVEYTGKMKK